MQYVRKAFITVAVFFAVWCVVLADALIPRRRLQGEAEEFEWGLTRHGGGGMIVGKEYEATPDIAGSEDWISWKRWAVVVCDTNSNQEQTVAICPTSGWADRIARALNATGDRMPGRDNDF